MLFVERFFTALLASTADRSTIATDLDAAPLREGRALLRRHSAAERHRLALHGRHSS
jgi:hypothetical protein